MSGSGEAVGYPSPVTPLIINHWVVGATALAILLLLLLALLVFGAGREHS
jgi:hypothetical protein